MNKEYLIKSEEDTINFTQYLSKFVDRYKLILLDGNLGSGKSFICFQLSKILLKNCSIDFSSPSFGILNIYDAPNFKIYHLDLYRISDISHLYEIGIDEILETADLTLIEWPQIIMSMIKEYNFLHIKLKLIDKNRRTFTLINNLVSE